MKLQPGNDLAFVFSAKTDKQTDGEMELMIQELSAVAHKYGYKMDTYGNRTTIRNMHFKEIATALVGSVDAFLTQFERAENYMINQEKKA